MLAKIEGAALVAEGVITEIEREALVELRDRLRRDEIEHYNYTDDVPHGLSLQMCKWHIKHACGTVGCVAGLCYEISGGGAFQEFLPTLGNGTSVIRNEKLQRLFLPTHQERRTPAEAAHAIATFLATGHAEWAAL